MRTAAFLLLEVAFGVTLSALPNAWALAFASAVVFVLAVAALKRVRRRQAGFNARN